MPICSCWCVAHESGDPSAAVTAGVQGTRHLMLKIEYLKWVNTNCGPPDARTDHGVKLLCGTTWDFPKHAFMNRYELNDVKTRPEWRVCESCLTIDERLGEGRRHELT